MSVSAVADVSYLAEVAPKAFRGGMVSCNELAISFGMLAAFKAGHALRNMHGKTNSSKDVRGTANHPARAHALFCHRENIRYAVLVQQ